MYVLDTNTLIYFFKGQGKVVENLLSTSPKEIAIPSIVLYELEFGIAKSTSPEKRTTQLAELCGLVTILEFGKAESKESAQVRFELEKKGTPIGPYDILIAGTTLACNGVMVTNNVHEFSRITNLRTINWYC